MDILFLRSRGKKGPQGPYNVEMDTAYADRVIGNLADTGDYCSACGDECISCRDRYDLDFSDDITGIIDFPAVLPAIIDDPEEYLPEEAPEAEICISISVHEEILIGFLEQFPVFKGVIVPRESVNWISPYGIRNVREICGRYEMACAFPKPFCSFAPETGILKAFQEHVRIGRPEVDFKTEDGKIIHSRVRCSAPCGATYYVARQAEGEKCDENLGVRTDTFLSSYPCTASHALDPEFGDSIMHEAVKIQRRIVENVTSDCNIG